MPNLPRFLAHFDQDYKIFATKLRFRIRRVVLERVSTALRSTTTTIYFALYIKYFTAEKKFNFNKQKKKKKDYSE